jgi:hypothetical protein
VLDGKDISNEVCHGSVYEMMEFKDSKVVSINKIYRTRTQLKSISSAIGFGDHFYVGSVLDNAILVCKRDNYQMKFGLLM